MARLLHHPNVRPFHLRFKGQRHILLILERCLVAAVLIMKQPAVVIVQATKGNRGEETGTQAVTFTFSLTPGAQAEFGVTD